MRPHCDDAGLPTGVFTVKCCSVTGVPAGVGEIAGSDQIQRWPPLRVVATPSQGSSTSSYFWNAPLSLVVPQSASPDGVEPSMTAPSFTFATPLRPYW